MQPTLCARCHKNMAVVFITKIENNQTKNEGLCLSCARELHIKPVDDPAWASRTRTWTASPAR